MDEKTAMNVEFLRARLLSERIVSKTARQRAEMLAQRVIELEEQLRIVNIQRKKAEKAAEEVLSILETQGITGISGLTDSSTDQEDNQHTDQQGIQCTDSAYDEFLTVHRMDRSEVDDGSSCSDIDGPPSNYNRLSWKSHGSSLDTQEPATKQNKHRQRSSFIITLKSTQRRPGKSCRKIKRHDVGSASENELQKPTLLDVHGNGVVAHLDDFDEKHESPLDASKNMEKFSADSSLSFCSDVRNRGSKDVGGKDDMERALKQQAQLIMQFQAMENAQKEWEEKFDESKVSMLDNPEPGNQVNVAENSNWSAGNSMLVGWIPQHEKEEKISVKDISFTEDKTAGRCRNCEMANERVAIDKFSPSILSTSLSSPCRNSSNGCTNGLLNPLCESTALNVIKTVSKVFTFPPQDGPDLARKVHLGPIFGTSNTGSASNVEVHPHDLEVLQCSSTEHHAPDNKTILHRLELPESRQEHPRYPSQAHGLMEQQYDTMALNEAKHATQVFTIPSQGSPLVAKRQDLHRNSKVNLHRNSKVNPPGQGILHTSLTEKLGPIANENISNRELPEVKELPRQLYRASNSSLGSVLQSLQRARISITQELIKRPSSAQGTLTIAAPANSPIKPTPSCKALDVPIGSSVLFRLPSDSFTQALSGPNVYGSGLRLTATRPDLGFMIPTVSAGKEYLNQSPSASYLQPGSKVSFSKDYADRYPFNPYMDGISGGQVCKEYVNHYPTGCVESESQVLTVKEYFDRQLSSSISTSSANENPIYNPGLSTKRLSLHNELSKSSSDLISRMPYSNRNTYSNNCIFSNF